MLDAIIYKNGKLTILNQLLLPHETKYDDLTTVEAAWEAINKMKVRGAPAISIVAALSMASELQSRTFSSKVDLFDFLVDNFKYFVTARPTAVNLRQVSEKTTVIAHKWLKDESETVQGMQTRIVKLLESIFQTDVNINKAIGKYGGEHMLEKFGSEKLCVLTHCNTGSLATAGYGTALGVIRWLHEHRKLEHAYCTETRPYNQGARLTAYELVHEKIPATLICDNMVSALMKTKKISAVVVGADRVVANGDTANKIGTYQIAVCAKYHGIPFYVASPRSTFDFTLEEGSKIPIEERPKSEMVEINSIRIAAEGINCWNPAFDVTPAELITGGIITECGVFPANKINENKSVLSTFDIFS